MDEATALRDLARDNLASARDNLSHAPPRASVAYSEARHAAELAGKSLLMRKTGAYPWKHEIGAVLYQAGVLPSSANPRQADRLLRSSTRGEYGVFDVPTPEECAEMVALAELLL